MDNLAHENDPDTPGANDLASPLTGESVSKPRTFGDVIAAIRKDDTLASQRRRDVLSSLKRFLEIVHRGESLEASPVVVRTLARRSTPPDARVKKKRWSTIRSDVLFALAHVGLGTRAPTRKDLTPEWSVLRAALEPEEFGSLRRGLSRLMHWAAARDIEPGTVDNRTMTAFHSFLKVDAVVAKPDMLYRLACRRWNDAVDQVAGWPCRKVEVPSFRDHVSLPTSEFQEAFLGETDAYVALLTSPRLSDRLKSRGSDRPTSGRRRGRGPLRDATATARRYQIRRISSALVRSGFAADGLITLRQLVEPRNFEKALVWYEDYLGGMRPSLEELANGMIAMARHHIRVSDEDLRELQDIRDELRCRTRGMTDKNRERLRPFKDPMVLRSFLGLSDKLLAKAAKGRAGARARGRNVPSTRPALLVQQAVMHDLLLWAPMRIENLCQLHLDRHLVFNDAGAKGAIRLVIPAQEVKNGVALEYLLPMRAARLLTRYIEGERHEILQTADEGWLFPSTARGHKHKATMQEQITKTAQRYCGIAINPHLYRHIAAYLHLRRHPDDIETVRRILGHKRIETTLSFYAEMDRDRASQRYVDGVLEHYLEGGRL